MCVNSGRHVTASLPKSGQLSTLSALPRPPVVSTFLLFFCRLTTFTCFLVHIEENLARVCKAHTLTPVTFQPVSVAWVVARGDGGSERESSRSRRRLQQQRQQDEHHWHQQQQQIATTPHLCPLDPVLSRYDDPRSAFPCPAHRLTLVNLSPPYFLSHFVLRPTTEMPSTEKPYLRVRLPLQSLCDHSPCLDSVFWSPAVTSVSHPFNSPALTFSSIGGVS